IPLAIEAPLLDVELVETSRATLPSVLEREVADVRAVDAHRRPAMLEQSDVAAEAAADVEHGGVVERRQHLAHDALQMAMYRARLLMVTIDIGPHLVVIGDDGRPRDGCHLQHTRSRPSSSSMSGVSVFKPGRRCWNARFSDQESLTTATRDGSSAYARSIVSSPFILSSATVMASNTRGTMWWSITISTSPFRVSRN